MAVQLSYSSVFNKYLRCPLSYHMHYNLGIREEWTGSSLLMGSACDEAAGAILQSYTLPKATEIFNDTLSDLLAKTPKIKFTKTHIDEANLRVVGEEILKEYQRKILPEIKDVLAVQKKLELKNDDGDKIVGYVDFIAELNDGRKIIFDNKTSSRKYKSDRIQTEGQQLCLYEFLNPEKVDGVGYVVMETVLRKSFPRARISMLVDEVPRELQKQTMQIMTQTLQKIRLGEFPSNHPSCNSYFGECICQNYYLSGGQDLTGLRYVR